MSAATQVRVFSESAMAPVYDLEVKNSQAALKNLLSDCSSGKDYKIPSLNTL